ncbi:hypothetical protein KEJ32_05440 [Candidatus Bathyarchaeota archaeon]|nr:hypothetical protein [Candidatus Bathyarchaeota archaeon]
MSLELLTPLIFVLVVNVLTEGLKLLTSKLWSERAKDIIFAVLAGVFVALGKVLGVITLDWSVVLPLLFAPQGVFVVVKKLLGK